jgi:hypothetical protein
MDEIPSRLERPASSQPPLSPASSLSSEPSSEVPAVAPVKKSLRAKDEVVKPTFQRASLRRLCSSAGSDTSTTTRRSNRSGNTRDPVEAPLTHKENADDKSAWSVLVAVRCRPRKRQRAEKRFTRVDDRLRHPRYRASHYSSSASSGSDESDSHRPSAGSVQRGVFEYSACRDYDYASTYDGKIPPPRVQRPRRLYVQASTHSIGGSSGRRSFDFDFVFPPWKKQRDVYDQCVEAQIRHVLEAQQQGLPRHATIVAYGQTGTGKTYTMGMLSDFTEETQRGIIPRAMAQILEFAANAKDEADSLETVVTLSFLQIYLETVQDLLVLPGSVSHDTSRSSRDARRGASDLPVRQGRDGAFYVTGLSEYEITTAEDAHALLELATRNRVLAATAKNKTSSRSHTLLTISVKRRRHGAARGRRSSSEDEDEEHDEDSSGDEEDEFRQASTISFVDLAGSERVDGALHFLRATRARQEQRIREAKFINRSLSALGGVIAALAQPKSSASTPTSARVLARLNPDSVQQNTQHPAGNEPHIRFRDSQLTKLLQGRLMGGRGRLLLIATVDDQPPNLSETLSTLKFAAQCRRVELQPGSRLRADRTTRLRRQDSLLDQVFNDMKATYESREAVLQVRVALVFVVPLEWRITRSFRLGRVNTRGALKRWNGSWKPLELQRSHRRKTWHRCTLRPTQRFVHWWTRFAPSEMIERESTHASPSSRASRTCWTTSPCFTLG